jgi:tRNA nucleotidyltransferase/poly(A) polymerase
MFDIFLPCEVETMLDKLKANGYEAFVVGGCVRDSIIGRFPADWDVTTNALPEQVKALFPKTIDTGIKHGTVTILFDKMSIEVTTYRIDGVYNDNRHPSGIEFSCSIDRDLSRRDFTVNAIAYNPSRGFVDPFMGIKDIENRLIRTVGNAGDRFREDALRMLRAIRFSAQLGYDVHTDILDSIAANCYLIDNISRERIRDELGKIVLSDNPNKFMLLNSTGLLGYILPELACIISVYSTGNEQFHNIFNAIAGSQKDICIRFSVLLTYLAGFMRGSIDENTAGAILYRLRFDNKSIKRVTDIIKNIEVEIKPDLKSVMKKLSLLGRELLFDIINVKETLLKSDDCESNKKGLDILHKIKELYREIITNGYCTDLKSLAIDGNDLIGIGYTCGREMGVILNRLLDAVIDKPELNEKGILLEMASTMSGLV